MKIKGFAGLTMGRAFRKGVMGGSKMWRYGFWIGVAFKILKFLFKKPEPKTFDQYDLEPGEYKVIVKETKK